MTDIPEIKPSTQPQPFKPDPDSDRLKRNALIGFFILLVGIFTVVLILPAQLDKKKERSQTSLKAEDGKAGEIDSTALEGKRRAVEELTKEILKIQARLENENVQVWGAEKLVTSYPEVMALLAQADDDASRQRYEQALAGYRDVKDRLEQLEDSRPQRGALGMSKGDDAFEQLDSEAAIYHYGIAVSADPADIEAQRQLTRAENLAQVLDHLKEGARLEADGQLEHAWQEYKDAVELDKEFQPAVDDFQRLNTIMADREFRKAMSDAQSALLRENIPKATAALGKARGLKPDDASLLDLEQQLKNSKLRIEHQRLGQEALQHEFKEEWDQAAAVYDRILSIDANTGFALQGKNRVEDHLAMIGEIENYLSQPDRLQEPEYRQHAREIYTLALAHSEPGPEFLKLTGQLNSLLDEYNKPVPVTIYSDGLTDVRIYRIGRFGKFTEYQVELLPGQYRAEGSRSGYRDVLTSFSVPVSGEEINLEVICRESI